MTLASMVRMLSQSLALLLGVGVLFNTGSARADAVNILEEFQQDDFDRERWKLDKFEEKDFTVEINEGSLHVTAPAGPKDRPQFRFLSKFGLEGDFEAGMEFQAIHLPDPASDFVNTEMILAGKGGTAFFARTNHHGAGQGFVVFFLPPKESGKKSVWKHHPLDIAKGKLKVTRVGDDMTFSVLPDGETTAKDIVSVNYGSTRVDRLTCAVGVKGEVDSPVEVRIDNIYAKTLDRASAAQIASTSSPPESKKSLFGPASWIAVVVVVVVAGGLGFVLWRSKGSA